MWRGAPQVEVRRSDVQSAWSGLRPLAMDPNAADTASASRDHIVTRDPRWPHHCHRWPPTCLEHPAAALGSICLFNWGS